MIGLPAEDQWPDVSLPWGSFAHTAPRALEQFIPEICPEGLDLLQVIAIFFFFSNSLVNGLFVGLPVAVLVQHNYIVVCTIFWQN